jgi:hypothetical protein
MFSVPEGRAANQPLVETTFSPPIAASFPGARVSFAVIGSPCEFCGCDGFGREFLKQVLLLGRGGSVDAGIEWRSQFDGHFLVVLARVFSCTSRVSAASRLRMMPSLSVLHTVPLCRRKLAPALSSPPKRDRCRKRCRTGPLGLPG